MNKLNPNFKDTPKKNDIFIKKINNLFLISAYDLVFLECKRHFESNIKIIADYLNFQDILNSSQLTKKLNDLKKSEFDEFKILLLRLTDIFNSAQSEIISEKDSIVILMKLIKSFNLHLIEFNKNLKKRENISNCQPNESLNTRILIGLYLNYFNKFNGPTCLYHSIPDKKIDSRLEKELFDIMNKDTGFHIVEYSNYSILSQCFDLISEKSRGNRDLIQIGFYYDSLILKKLSPAKNKSLEWLMVHLSELLQSKKNISQGLGFQKDMLNDYSSNYETILNYQKILLIFFEFEQEILNLFNDRDLIVENKLFKSQYVKKMRSLGELLKIIRK